MSARHVGRQVHVHADGPRSASRSHGRLHLPKIASSLAYSTFGQRQNASGSETNCWSEVQGEGAGHPRPRRYQAAKPDHAYLCRLDSSTAPRRQKRPAAFPAYSKVAHAETEAWQPGYPLAMPLIRDKMAPGGHLTSYPQGTAADDGACRPDPGKLCSGPKVRGVPIVVAVKWIDKPEAAPDNIKNGPGLP